MRLRRLVLRRRERHPPEQDGSDGKDARSPEGHHKRADTYRRIATEVRPHWKPVLVLLLVDLLATPLWLLIPLPLKIAIDSVIGSKPLPGFLDLFLPSWAVSTDTRLLILTAFLQVFFVLLAQLQQVGSYVGHTRMGEKMTLAFRERLFRHAQRLSLTYHDTKGTTDSLYRIQYDAPALQHIVDSLIPFVASGFMLVSAVYVTARINIQLALVALTVAPTMFLIARSYLRRVHKGYREFRDIESSALAVVQEVLAAIRVVKAFGREEQERDRFVTRSDAGVQTRVKLSLAESGFGLIVNLITACGTALVLFVGISNVRSGVLTLGELMVVMAYLTRLYGPLEDVSQKVGDMQSSVASAERAFELLDQHPEVAERRGARPLSRAKGAIEFRDVCFAYEPGSFALQDLSFAVPSGGRIGISGRTGAGKTTILSLLMRFYDPISGRILLDDVDLRDYRLSDLRNQFGMVLQDPVLFSTSIGENIAYARRGANRVEIEEAARAAGAHHFIMRLPERYETVVGERGMRLSGGERQRISLARAFLKNAPILILDEPTSSVDVKTEAAIMDALHSLMQGRTTLMIAHRLSTLDYCDVRLEVDDGRLKAAHCSPGELVAQRPADTTGRTEQ
ncbi:MAG: ABC transporter ATP-binding protein/permease [Actinomycetota bacterium]|nr:ABC transporter ATP-binding protein/permease [Actinomycetota bacterium]